MCKKNKDGKGLEENFHSPLDSDYPEEMWDAPVLEETDIPKMGVRDVRDPAFQDNGIPKMPKKK